jgi:hypothetical protein
MGEHACEMEHGDVKAVVHMAAAVVAWSGGNGTPLAVHGGRGRAQHCGEGERRESEVRRARVRRKRRRTARPLPNGT